MLKGQLKIEDGTGQVMSVLDCPLSVISSRLSGPGSQLSVVSCQFQFFYCRFVG
jgi:hypothetical protein